MKKYGESFLTKPRWFTKNAKKAGDSIWMYGWDKNDKIYFLTIVGIINGILPLFGLVFVVNIDNLSKQINGYRISKKWW